MNVNENKNNNPVQFLDNAGVANETEKMKKLMDALMFGVPTLAEKLYSILDVHGLDGLRDFERNMDKYIIIRMICNNEININIDLSNGGRDSATVDNNSADSADVINDNFNAEEW